VVLLRVLFGAGPVSCTTVPVALWSPTFSNRSINGLVSPVLNPPALLFASPSLRFQFPTENDSLALCERQATLDLERPAHKNSTAPPTTRAFRFPCITGWHAMYR
jgi:hypothetical protein